MKICNICQKKKSKDLFIPRNHACKSCRNKKSRDWYWNNKERMLKTGKEWRKRNPKRYLHLNLKNKYGLSLKEYNSLKRKQGDVCAICKKPCQKHKRLSVDHCHKTERIRGLLCEACNHGLGKFKDDPKLLMRASLYLTEIPEM